MQLQETKNPCCCPWKLLEGTKPVNTTDYRSQLDHIYTKISVTAQNRSIFESHFSDHKPRNRPALQIYVFHLPMSVPLNAYQAPP